MRKIRIWGVGCEILASLAVVDDPAVIGIDEIGLGEQAFQRLGLAEGTEVEIAQARPPASLEFVRRKIDGEALGDGEIAAIIRDVASHRYSHMEIAAWLVACAGFMTTQETLALTRAMVDVGNRLHWQSPLVVDKHCIGGIPGNRTSMIVVPIVAAHGLVCPKTSSRAITSPSGTADTMEVLANVDLPEERLTAIVAKHNAVLAWGGRIGLSPADDVLIAVERPLSLDSPAQMVASILSKKIAAGSTHLVLDIPIGPTAKVRSMPEAQRLRRLFEYVASRMHLSLEVLITDGRQPVGQGVGPMLEARDVMRVLENDPRAPNDLRQKSLRLAGRLIEADPDVRGGDGFAIARDILDSGRALSRMQAIIAAQGARPFDHNHPPLGALTLEVCAPADGVVIGIDNLQIARVARMAGAPKVQSAGVDLLHKLGDSVTQGTPLYRVHAAYPSDLEFATQLCRKASGYTLGQAHEVPHVFVEF